MSVDWEELEVEHFVAERRAPYGRAEDMRTYRDLMAWQESMDLAELCYRVANGFPANENYGLMSQIKRAAVSVPSNIAEGWGRDTAGDFDRFIAVSSGSLREVETQLLLALRFGFGDQDLLAKTLDHCDRVGGLLYRLRKSIQARRTP